MHAPMQPNYRGYPQPVHHRQPTTPRRGVPVPGMMPMQVAQHNMPNPQVLAAQQRHVPVHPDAAIRRSRKPTDKTLPDGIEEVVIGDAVQQYKRMQEVERRLDSAIMRKRIDLQDTVNRNTRRYRTMRLWISNTVEQQPWQQAEQNPEVPPRIGAGRYRVKIEGRLLDDATDPTVPDEDEEDIDMKHLGGEKDPDAMEEDSKPQKREEAKPSSPSIRKRLSHFFKTISVEFDKPSSPGVADLATIIWNKPTLPPSAAALPPTADFDSLEFSRAAEVNINGTITMTRDENLERFLLSKELASILDIEEETRAGIIIGLWEYIKTAGLQESEEKQAVACNERLRAIFGRDKIYFPAIPELIGPHCTPLPPIKIPFTIRVDKEFHSKPIPAIYDIRVAVDDPLRNKMLQVTTSPDFPNMLRQVSSLDDQLALVVQALHHSKAKHSFYTNLSQDPVNFIKRWILSQRRDLETILGESTRAGRPDPNAPEFRRGGLNSAWDTPVAREAARYMLARPPHMGR
ncbi:SWI-SNF complex subunit [Coccidioides immitis RS]|uniref:SWI-SNF complex subunit n=2 Tax=Coccidioides immitis TaxID=5501 RepID=J3KBI7_COCIM|nr:SWI-SNF complex subunit [Coccidioides immitis RS]EAS32491.3 SWI-SNF complex subunit [Coccidioides immitis RS]KMP07728.1 SWI/SNF complex 60 KDa subunit [Coccidioides immitis RMSCC 2394]